MISPDSRQASKVVIYDVPTHPSAAAARKFFLLNNIRFEERDVTRSALWAEHLMKQTGQNNDPLIEAAGKSLVGFTSTVQKQLEADLKALR